jgi:tyrosine-protein phosphatase SIW14
MNTSKRTPRTQDDSAHHEQRALSSKNSSSILSRRDSWASVADDFIPLPTDIEEALRSKGLLRESSVSSSSCTSSTCYSSSNTSLASDMGAKIAEKSVNTAHAAASVAVTHMQAKSDITSAPDDGRPVNFGAVVQGVFRSSYPAAENFGFLGGLKLKTMITLVQNDELASDLADFAKTNGIKHIFIDMKGTKKESIPAATMQSILGLLLNTANYPILIHCNKGKHRTGCVVAAFRKVSGWAHQAVLDEYRSYAAPKIRDCDLEYISTLNLESIVEAAAHKCPTRFTPTRTRTFYRSLIISLVLMAVWLTLGASIFGARDASAVNKDA